MLRLQSMTIIHFRELAKDDVPVIHAWHEDPELAGRYGGRAWPEKLWDIMQKDSNRKCWLAIHEGLIIGYVDFEIHDDDKSAWIGLAVSPELRGKGFGKKILQQFLSQPFVKEYAEIKAGIEPDNIASVKCFAGVGFKPVSEELDEEGVMDFSYKIHRDQE